MTDEQEIEIPDSFVNDNNPVEQFNKENSVESQNEFSLSDIGLSEEDILGFAGVNRDVENEPIAEEKENEESETDGALEEDLDEDLSEDISDYDRLIEYGIENGEFEALTLDQINEIRSQFEDPKEAFVHIKRYEKEAFAENYIANNFLSSLSPEVRLLVEAELSGVDINKYREVENAYKYYDSIQEENFNDEEFLINIIANKVYSDMANAGKSITQEDAINRAKLRYDSDPELAELEAKRFVDENKFNLSKLMDSMFPESEKARVEREKAEARAIEEFPLKVKSFLSESKEIIKGVPLDSNVADKIIAAITHPHAQDEQGNLYNYVQYIQKQNPEKFTARLTYLALAGLFDDNVGPDRLIAIAQSMKQQSKVTGNAGISKVLSNINKGGTQQSKKSNKIARLSDIEDYI